MMEQRWLTSTGVKEISGPKLMRNVGLRRSAHRTPRLQLRRKGAAGRRPCVMSIDPSRFYSVQTFSGVPAAQAETFPNSITARRAMASSVRKATCGVKMVFGAFNRA